MSRLTPTTAREALRNLKKFGFTEHQQRGRRPVLKHNDEPMVVLPMHAKDIPRGTLHNILHQTKLSLEDWPKA
jgi:predicted RNA binding protein YcfA (HicA-like mRNA interferase family)